VDNRSSGRLDHPGICHRIIRASRPPAQTIQMAVVVIATVPILIVYPFLQRYFTKGVPERGYQRP